MTIGEAEAKQLALDRIDKALNKQGISFTIPAYALLGSAILVALKVKHVLTLSWTLALSPIWGSALLTFTFSLFMFFVLGLMRSLILHGNVKFVEKEK